MLGGDEPTTGSVRLTHVIATIQNTSASTAIYLQLGVLLVAADTTVCHPNQVAEAILRQSDGLGWSAPNCALRQHGSASAEWQRCPAVLLMSEYIAHSLSRDDG